MITLKKFKTTEPDALDTEIVRLFESLQAWTPDTDQYDAASDQLVKLVKLRGELNSKKRISPDVLLGAGANLAGILLILNFEHAHVLTSKAIGFVGKKLIS